MAGVLLTAPNMAKALYTFGLIPRSSNDSSTIGRARRRLIRKGLLVKSDSGFLRLSNTGAAKVRMLEAQYSDKRPPRWDGRWRVLIFDVPEYRKSIRDKIRRTLMHVGFIRLQDSVWVCPYDCEDLIVLLKADFKIGKDLLYMIVDELEGDADLRKNFGLKKRD